MCDIMFCIELTQDDDTKTIFISKSYIAVVHTEKGRHIIFMWIGK